jgi:hypothetical protein
LRHQQDNRATEQTYSLLTKSLQIGTIQAREEDLEYTDAPPSETAPNESQTMACPLCGKTLPKDAQSCDQCDWTQQQQSEGAEGKASDAMAVLLSVIPGLGHIYKGHKLAGFLWMAGAVPAGIFVFLAAIASAGFGIGLFFFYLIAVMLHAYAIDDRITPGIHDEGEQY